MLGLGLTRTFPTLFRESAVAEQARFITARAFLTMPARMLRGQALFIDGTR